MHGGTAVIAGRFGDCAVVGDVDKWTYPQLYGTEYARHPPHVLTFEITAVAPPVDLHGQSVASFADISGDIEFGRGHGILAVSYALPVDP